MTHEITLTTTESTEVIGIVLETSPATIGQDVHRAFERLSKVLSDVHVEASGPPRVVYERVGQDRWTIECCIPAEGVVDFPRASEFPDDIVAHMMQGGQAAHTIHLGAYDGLGEAYGDVGHWLVAQGLHPSLDRHQYEIYLNDPSTVTPDHYATEVVVPLA